MQQSSLARRLAALLVVFAPALTGQAPAAPSPTGSYMKVPRLHFSGSFYCDVSTVNNQPLNYQPEVTAPEPWWNPDGTHVIDFRDCVITGVYDDAGTYVSQPHDDPIAGAALTTSKAVLVDLDTDQQGVSMYYGFDVKLVMPRPGDVPLTVGGPMDPAGLNGLWWQVMPALAGGRGGDFNASARYQSVLRIDPKTWPTPSGSAVLDALRAACDRDASGQLLVLIAYTTNAYQDSDVNEAFKLGSVTGTLAPWKSHEPIHAPGQRWLKPRAWDPSDPAQVAFSTDPGAQPQQRWDYQVFNGGPFFVDELRKRLVVDLANCIPIQRLANPAAADGSYSDVSAVSGVTAYVVHDGTRTALGRVDVSAFCKLEIAGLSEVALTDEQLRLLRDHPLQLEAAHVNSGSPVILAEDPSGLDFAATARVFRLAHDIPYSATPVLGTLRRATSQVLVTRWGRPEAGVQLHSSVSNLHTGVEVDQPIGSQDALLWGGLQWWVTPSDSAGLATVTLEAVADPGDRTPELDGQMYGLEFSTPARPAQPGVVALRHGSSPVASAYNEPSQERSLSIHLYSDYTAPESPTWADIEPIMAPYAKLYPAMREKIDLSVEATFNFYSLQPPGGTPPLPLFLGAPFGSARYMPISRDLSPNKYRAVMTYIRNLQDQAQSAEAGR